jgi:hypothetical protein
MKKLLALTLIALSFATGFTCSKQETAEAPAEMAPPAQEEMAAPPAEEMPPMEAPPAEAPPADQ